MKLVRVVMISDTHGMECDVPDGDILVHAGDLTMTGTSGQIERAGNWLRSLPHRHKIVVAGNHDWKFERNQAQALFALGEGFHYLENNGVELEGLKFWGSPVTPWFYDWAFNVRRGADILEYWNQIPSGLDMLITHGPPRGILDQASPKMNTEHCGCDDLLLAVKEKKPKVHVFGHIHGGYGQAVVGETAFYNVSIVDEAYKVAHKPWWTDFCTEG